MSAVRLARDKRGTLKCGSHLWSVFGMVDLLLWSVAYIYNIYIYIYIYIYNWPWSLIYIYIYIYICVYTDHSAWWSPMLHKCPGRSTCTAGHFGPSWTDHQAALVFVLCLQGVWVTCGPGNLISTMSPKSVSPPAFPPALTAQHAMAAQRAAVQTKPDDVSSQASWSVLT